ncbi:secondary thiamine-phosphate synthase enzyme YjbQ [Patescibacteria group bacterium]|nr:secondary thiamine-phosphate synthase enzyme YjbQ [Patescibacteria group bacterium]
MKSKTEYLHLKTDKPIEIVNITSEVERVVRESGIEEGLCLVNSMHITSSVFINDEESGLKEDFVKWLEKLVPNNVEKYKHNLTSEDNAHSHLKRTIMGREVIVAITNGKLDFGTWEQIFYGEFDGQREKRILIKVIGE